LVLLSLDWIRPKDPRTTLGSASLQARLATAPGLEVVALARNVNVANFDRMELLNAILSACFPADDLAIGVYIWNEPVVQWLLPALRHAGFMGRIILGGPQITHAPVGVLTSYPDADIAVRGYGEDALLAIATGANWASLPGVILQGGPDRLTPVTTDLTTLPSPILSGVIPVTPFMRWETQRGCIYACTFCQHRENDVRARPKGLASERILAEVDALVAGGATDIAVLDPIFHTNPAAVEILQRFAARGYRGRLSLQSRFELIDDRFLDACAALDVRLEFGLQTIHRAEMKAIRRMNDLNAADRVIAQLHTRQIPFEVSLIYGLPEQTLKSFQQSVQWCLDRRVPVVRAFPLMLLRGTGLDLDRDRFGLVENDSPIPLVVSSFSFDEADWQQMCTIAENLDAVPPTAGA
jgi:radical SAM superfamily enzyme YgiQ (UPF0313 family)